MIDYVAFVLITLQIGCSAFLIHNHLDRIKAQLDRIEKELACSEER